MFVPYLAVIHRTSVPVMAAGLPGALESRCDKAVPRLKKHPRAAVRLVKGSTKFRPARQLQVATLRHLQRLQTATNARGRHHGGTCIVHRLRLAGAMRSQDMCR
jgi:hypothetical protein